jgi:D-alanyl-D-alanine carboxypeptidase (penicillin-binding protein 5/6)
MKKILFVFLILVSLFIIPVKAEEQMASNAKSAILIEASTGTILFEKNSNEKFAPASMTKMMSLLIIMENIDNGNLKMDEIVKASKHAASMGGSQIYLEENEEMKVEDMLKGITIGSANDATVALAERIAGTEDKFVEMMNAKVKELGLKNTNFKNSTGLDEANHYSSSYDMAIIAKELVKHKKILDFSSIYETYLRTDSDSKFWLVNTNKLVRFYKGVDGLKTGYTEEAGYCLTATINKDNMRLIAVVMGEPTSTIRNSEVSALLDYGYNLYQKHTYITKEEIIDNVKVDKGKKDKANIVVMDDVVRINKKGYKVGEVSYELNLNKLKAPINKGEKVGTLIIKEDGKKVSIADVTVEENIEKANYFVLYLRYIKEILSGNYNF